MSNLARGSHPPKHELTHVKKVPNMNTKVVHCILLLLLGCGATTAHALVLQKNQGHGYVEYLGLSGVQEGRNAPYRLLLPSCWKGTLLVYARGTGSLVRVDANGRPLGSDGNVLSEGGFPLLGLTPLANGLPEITPGALIPSPDDGTLSGTLSAFESRLLNLCYALAATDYRLDPRFAQDRLLGWIVEDGYRHPALTVGQKHPVGADKAPAHHLWGRSRGLVSCPEHH
jgi:hypothetical protein